MHINANMSHLTAILVQLSLCEVSCCFSGYMAVCCLWCSQVILCFKNCSIYFWPKSHWKVQDTPVKGYLFVCIPVKGLLIGCITHWMVCGGVGLMLPINQSWYHISYYVCQLKACKQSTGHENILCVCFWSCSSSSLGSPSILSFCGKPQRPESYLAHLRPYSFNHTLQAGSTALLGQLLSTMEKSKQSELSLFNQVNVTIHHLRKDMLAMAR